MRPYEEREFTLGNVIGEALSLYSRFFVRFFVLALIVFAATNLVSALSTTTSNTSVRLLWFVAAFVANIVGFFWLQGALVAQVDDVRDGKVDSSIAEIFRRTGDQLPSLIGVGFLIGVVMAAVAAGLVLLGYAIGATWLGVLVAFVVAVFFATRTVIATPAVVLEHLGPIDAVKRSWNLVKGHSWRVFWVIIVSGILAGIVGGIINSIVRAMLSGFLEVWLGSSISNALTTPFLALAWTLAYFHLREPTAESANPIPAGAAFSE